MIMRRLTTVISLVVLFAVTALAQNIEKQNAPYTSPTSGRAMYKAYCASCHGLDADGEGPAAYTMFRKPTDLRKLAADHNGVFPMDHVAAVIRGDVNAPSHGSKDMPVWGPVFLRMDQEHQGEVALRIKNLTEYIESLQIK